MRIIVIAVVRSKQYKTGYVMPNPILQGFKVHEGIEKITTFEIKELASKKLIITNPNLIRSLKTASFE